MRELIALAASAATHDGVAPFNEATLLALAAGTEPRHLDTVGDFAAAVAFGTAPAELVVHPDQRNRGTGRALLARALAAGETRFWAHGDSPVARRIAATHDLTAARLLLRLTRPSGPATDAATPNGVEIRNFTMSDLPALLQVNAAAFASHPEQGSMDAADFSARAAQPWFDPAGLFLAERDGELLGFHWTKVEAGAGEVYVLGVAPSARGTGVAAALLTQGVNHLHRSGAASTSLYVEGDNQPALALYRRAGFGETSRDVLYSR